MSTSAALASTVPMRQSLLPAEVSDLLARIPKNYLHDLAVDLAWAALVAPRRPDALYQVVQEWQATLDEIELDGDQLPHILAAREELRTQSQHLVTYERQ